MTIIERGTLSVRKHAVPCGQLYSYTVRCGACGLEVESLRADMPNRGLAHLRGPRSSMDDPVGQNGDGGDGRPWLIVAGNDANGGNFAPFVRCGDCRGDRSRSARRGGRSGPRALATASEALRGSPLSIRSRSSGA